MGYPYTNTTRRLKEPEPPWTVWKYICVLVVSGSISGVLSIPFYTLVLGRPLGYSVSVWIGGCIVWLVWQIWYNRRKQRRYCG